MLNYLLTDQVILGSLAWVGFIGAFFGLAIAIWQISKAKSAAEAARDASVAVSEAVFSRERLLELSGAISHVDTIKNYVAAGEYRTALIFADLSISSVTQINELLVQMPSEKRAVQKIIIGLREFTKKLINAESEDEVDQRTQLALEARDIINAMTAVAARLRYRYEDEVEG